MWTYCAHFPLTVLQSLDSLCHGILWNSPLTWRRNSDNGGRSQWRWFEEQCSLWGVEQACRWFGSRVHPIISVEVSLKPWLVLGQAGRQTGCCLVRLTCLWMCWAVRHGLWEGLAGCEKLIYYLLKGHVVHAHQVHKVCIMTYCPMRLAV